LFSLAIYLLEGKRRTYLKWYAGVRNETAQKNVRGFWGMCPQPPEEKIFESETS